MRCFVPQGTQTGAGGGAAEVCSASGSYLSPFTAPAKPVEAELSASARL
ncbi:MAG TPA: hypothetical protein VFS10_14345 [Pyrinomonadaceae bacterium]|nr:hypothetical protein [Pyrinomonadaceae bacterium]